MVSSMSERMHELPGWRLLCATFTVSFGGSFHFGYQLVITNPSQRVFIAYINDSFQKHYKNYLDTLTATAIWSAIVAVLFVGAILGSLMINVIAEHVGRKRGLCISIGFEIIAIAFSVVSYFVHSFELYTISRLFLGMTISLCIGLQALYINESSPKACRGFVSMITGINVQFGTVIGSIVAMPSLFGHSSCWWYIYLMEMIILVIVLATLPLIPESPGYLTRCGNDSSARRSIQFFWNCSADETEPILAEIKANMKQATASMSLLEVWKNGTTRNGTIVGMVVCFAMAFSGIAAINAFAVQILMQTGLSLMSASIGNIILSFMSLIATIISAFVVDRFGRRPLLLISLTVIIILNILIFVLMYLFDRFKYDWTGYTLVGVICIFIIFFAVGPGPLSFFITTEMVGQEARSSSQSWASLTQMTARTVLLAVFLPFSNAAGQAYAYLILFVVPVFCSVLYLYFTLPETKNKNLTEVLQATQQLPSLFQMFHRKR